jgi:hypothetical protein
MHKVCLSICLSKPIRNELLYFSSFRCSEKSLLQVIDAQESESEVGFSLWVSIGQKLDQSETSFSIFLFFDVLRKVCYRLSVPSNSNPRSDFLSEFPLVRNSTNQIEGLIKLTNQMKEPKIDQSNSRTPKIDQSDEGILKFTNQIEGPENWPVKWKESQNWSTGWRPLKI